MLTYIDTHTHLYLEQFDKDRNSAVENAVQAGVEYMLLPNVDEETIQPMMDLCETFPANCKPMMALHPTSVKADFEEVLARIKPWFEKGKMCAVGETGIDLYWDKTFFAQQVQAFKTQIEWALEYDLPVVIHSRKSVEEIMQVLEAYRGTGLKGVMHCFPGNVQQAHWFTEFGFRLGIGGVVTYKKSMMADVVKHTDLKHLLLETDAPYLPPVPHRGKRNEPAYIPHIAAKIAEIKGVDIGQVARITTENAHKLFKLS
ncbi:MAG: TatD family deoxyribonuclease [Bacteroidetes bacterium]|nr:MAG: TatD family deoxyribonuclease [Bacteroidota bacterium]